VRGGDDDQSIYGWRGADIQKILGFHRDFEGAKVVRLQTNYRSTRPILDAANAVIRKNAARHEKALESARGHGEPVRFTRLADETAEALFVVREMRNLLRLEEAKPQDFAILCRTQVQFRPFEGELRANGLPYVVSGGMSFFDRKEVRDIVAYLKLAVNPRDETSLLRIINIPARGVGKASLDRVLAFATEHGISAAEAFERRARSTASPRRRSRATASSATPSTAPALRRAGSEPRRPPPAVPGDDRLPGRGDPPLRGAR
jgi:DNA helicase-2/ATP-dependent DNA helicase PcrA